MSAISQSWIVIGALVLLVLWAIVTYNGLVALRQRVSQAFADIGPKIRQ